MRVGSPLLQRRGGEGLTGGDLAYYRLLGETDRITTGPGRLEPTRTQEILRRHLPRPPANLLDIGGGTGAHAAWLAADGNRGELLDVVPEHVAAARLAEDGLAVTARLGDARELPVADDAFDAALLLGPLYHLTEREDRLTALREAAVPYGQAASSSSRRSTVSRPSSTASPRASSSSPASARSSKPTCAPAGTTTPATTRAGSPPPTSTTRTNCAPNATTPASTSSSSSAWRAWPAGCTRSPSAGTTPPPAPSSPNRPCSASALTRC